MSWRQRAADHRLLLVLLVPAVLIRVAAALTYWPALLFWRDSWLYLDASRSLHPPVTRALGYPVVLRALDAIGPLGLVTLVQHLAGLGVGIGIYALLRRRGLPGWGAAAAAAPVLLDGYQIDLEQFVVSETLFSVLLLILLALCLLGTRIGVVRAGGLGLVVAALALTRSVALPVAVVVGGYLLLRRVGPRALAAFAIAVVVPLGSYAAWFHSEQGAYGFSLMSGRLAFGKTAQFVDCSRLPAAERPLCPVPPPSHRFNADFYSFGPGSPQSRIPYTPEGDRTLSRFARAAVLAQPLTYAHVVATDLVHYAAPRRVPRFRDQRLRPWQFPTATNPNFTVAIPGRPGDDYAHLSHRPGGPTQVLRRYQMVTVPGTALALCGGLAAAGAWVRRRPRDLAEADLAATDLAATELAEAERAEAELALADATERRERADLLLLAVLGLLFVLVPAMTVALDYRFLLPELVVAPIGAALGLQRLFTWRGGAAPQPLRSTAKATAPSSTANANTS